MKEYIISYLMSILVVFWENLDLTIFNSELSPMELHLGHLNKLRGLYFVGNDIPELEDDWLSDAPPSLKELAFLLNNIGQIGNHAFSRLNSLRTLALDDTRFGPMKRSMFPDRLKSLILTNNSLTDLPVDLFSRMKSIDYVDLSDNRFTTLHERTWSPIWKKLGYLRLEGNNIVCDDRLNWVTKSKRRPYISGKCSAPKELEKTSLENYFISKTNWDI